MKAIGNRNLYLVGFMGSGKDKVGNILAARMGREIINTDALIVEREGMTINEIFDRRGERRFRDIEAQVLEEVSSRERLVVSTGGGAFCKLRNCELMLANGIVVWLDVDLSIIRERLKGRTIVRLREIRPKWRNCSGSAEACTGEHTSGYMWTPRCPPKKSPSVSYMRSGEIKKWAPRGSIRRRLLLCIRNSISPHF